LGQKQYPSALVRYWASVRAEVFQFSFLFLSSSSVFQLGSGSGRKNFKFPNIAKPYRCTIFFMTLHETFNDKHLLLPKAIPKDETYKTFLSRLLEQYILLLKSISPTSFKVEGLKKNINLTNVIKIQEKFIDGLNKTIEIYLDGQPAKAYEKFAEIIEYRKGKYENLLNIGNFEIDEDFYRIRKKEENFAFSSLEMFHIPFGSRGKVSTQRYSIPGFPSLYLAKTLYVAWEEMKRPSLNNFQAVRLQTKKQISFLDLTNNDWGSDNNNKTAYKYLMTWPLIAACSIKVRDYNDTFKPEYIIPQLLLQWIRNSGDIDAIKYNSTHIDKEELKVEGQLYNLVLPVKENKEEGYCSHLLSLFETTETISKQLLDYSTGGQTFLYTREEQEKINKKIPTLEIIKGRKAPYSYSELGHMELILSYMKTKKISN
jgi:hypothetical protein